MVLLGCPYQKFIAKSQPFQKILELDQHRRCRVAIPILLEDTSQ